MMAAKQYGKVTLEERDQVYQSTFCMQPILNKLYKAYNGPIVSLI